MYKYLILTALLLLPLQVQAQTAPSNSIVDTVISGFKLMPNAKEGIAIAFNNARVYNNLGVELVNGSYFGKIWGNISLDANYTGQDGVGPSIMVNLDILPKTSFPIVSFVQAHSSVGFLHAWRTLTVHGNGGNPPSDNKQFDAIVLEGKFSF